MKRSFEIRSTVTSLVARTAPTDHNSAWGQQRPKQRCQGAGPAPTLRLITATDIAVHHRGAGADVAQGTEKRLHQIADDHVGIIGNAVGMRRDAAIKNKNLTPRKQGAQMVVGPAIAKTQLENRTRYITNEVGSHLQAVALRNEPTYRAI